MLGDLTVEDVQLSDRQRRLLAALLLEPGRAVPVSRLLDAVWGDDHPSTPDNALRVQVSRLRKALEAAPELTITTVGRTYSIEVDPDSVDLHRFRRLVTEARTAPNPALLRTALELWQVDALRDLPESPLWNGVREALTLERRAVQEELERAENAPVVPMQVPRQLPAAIPGFTGREKELQELADRAGNVLITAIDGTAGVGKTALALHFGHTAVDRFPDGQLHANLRGFDLHDRPSRPSDVLTGFLRALGIKPELVPISEGEQAELFRTLMADRRMLVVLDNAAHADQVRPLLPGGASTCLITSRNRLAGLPAESLFLDVMSEDEAVALLREVLGPVDEDAARELARLCGYLPLALRIAAANAGEYLSETVAELREQNRLAALAIDDDEQVAVRAAFDLSYLALDAGQQRLFRRLGLIAGVDFTAESAALLAEGSLDSLVAANLVEEHTPGRYRLHDLLRLYAYERAQQDETAEELAEALDRYHRWYLDGIYTAVRSRATETMYLEPGTEIDLPDGWLETERSNLVTIATTAPKPLRPLFADRLHIFLRLGRHVTDLHTVAASALEAATDDRGRLTALHCLSGVYKSRGRLREAADKLEEAMSIAWPQARVRLLTALGGLAREMGDVEQAVEHYTTAMDVARENGQDELLHSLHFNVGAACWMQGRLVEAARAQREAARLAEARGLEQHSAYFRVAYGATLRDLGRLDEAVEEITAALALIRADGAAVHLSTTLADLTLLHRDAGRLDEAVRTGEETVELAEKIGDPSIEADARVALGSALLRRGDVAAGHAQLNRALVAARSAGYRHGEAAALVARHTTGDALQALTIARTAGYVLLERRALAVLAELHADREFYARQAVGS